MPDVYPAAASVVVGGGPLVVRGQVEIAAHGGAVMRAAKLRGLHLTPSVVGSSHLQIIAGTPES